MLQKMQSLYNSHKQTCTNTAKELQEQTPTKFRTPYDACQSLRLTSVGLAGPLGLGDIDPLNKVPFKRARNRVKKGPL